MLFGIKKEFAIEIYISNGKEFSFVNYCMWLNGRVFGDLEQNVVIGLCKSNFKNILRYQDKRDGNLFANIPNEVITSTMIFQIWNKELNQLSAAPPLKEINNNNHFENFNFNSYCDESFDGYYTFLIEYRLYDKLIVFDSIEDTIISGEINKGEIYRVIMECIDCI